ncbi:hypothetical protein BaRGS_00002692, partial [Batillaria attramentaria]
MVWCTKSLRRSYLDLSRVVTEIRINMHTPRRCHPTRLPLSTCHCTKGGKPQRQGREATGREGSSCWSVTGSQPFISKH